PQRSLERWAPRRISLRESNRQPLQEEIGRLRACRHPRTCKYRLADVDRTSPGGQPAGEVGCSECLEVGLPSERLIDRFELSRGSQQQRNRIAATPRCEGDL